MKVTDAQLASLARRRIYFGHQSVGYNVMDGVEELLVGHPKAGLKVVGLASGAAASQGPGFFHAANGTNEQPLTKIDGFAKGMAATMGGAADIAFYKFCYIDFGPDTEVTSLFERYKRSAQELRQQYPRTVFVHVTTPLTTVESGPKASLRKLLGRPDRLVQDNERRERFNALMRTEYGKDHLFDLAAIESTREDGRRRSVDANGHEVSALWDDYASDGRHLNERGRQWVAANLLEFLARVPER